MKQVWNTHRFLRKFWHIFMIGGLMILPSTGMAGLPLRATPDVKIARQEIQGSLRTIDRLYKRGRTEDAYEEYRDVMGRISRQPGLKRLFPEWVRKIGEQFNILKAKVLGIKAKPLVPTRVVAVEPAKIYTKQEIDVYVIDVVRKAQTITKDRAIFDGLMNPHDASPETWWQRRKVGYDEQQFSQILNTHAACLSLIETTAQAFIRTDEFKEFKSFVRTYEQKKALTKNDVVGEWSFWLLYHLVEKLPAAYQERPLTTKSKNELVRAAQQLFAHAVNIRHKEHIKREIQTVPVRLEEMKVNFQVALGKTAEEVTPSEIIENKNALIAQTPPAQRSAVVSLIEKLNDLGIEYAQLLEDTKQSTENIGALGYEPPEVASEEKKSSWVKKALIFALVAGVLCTTAFASYKVYGKMKENDMPLSEAVKGAY